MRDGLATLNGTLEVNVANISSTDLMVSPCPPHKAATANDQNMHRADALDGTATTEYNVNLYFKDFENDIYKNNVGAARWRSASDSSTGIAIAAAQPTGNDAETVTVYTLEGRAQTMKKADVQSLPSGIYIVNGQKYVVK